MKSLFKQIERTEKLLKEIERNLQGIKQSSTALKDKVEPLAKRCASAKAETAKWKRDILAMLIQVSYDLEIRTVGWKDCIWFLEKDGGLYRLSLTRAAEYDRDNVSRIGHFENPDSFILLCNRLLEGLVNYFEHQPKECSVEMRKLSQLASRINWLAKKRGK